MLQCSLVFQAPGIARNKVQTMVKLDYGVCIVVPQCNEEFAATLLELRLEFKPK